MHTEESAVITNLWTAGTSGGDNAEITRAPGRFMELRGEGRGTSGGGGKPIDASSHEVLIT